MLRALRIVAVATSLMLALSFSVRAQGLGSLSSTLGQIVGSLANIDPVILFPADDPALTDPAASEPATFNPKHLPKGGKFKLFGSMRRDRDPFNPFNEVISDNPQLLPVDQQTPDCAPYCNTFGGAYKKFGDHVQVAMLTDMLGVKYYFPSRTCYGGSPRISLAIDIDGDKTSDGNAWGYVGHGGFGTGCVTGAWDYVDLTDSTLNRWDLTQLGLLYHNWPSAVAAINAAYPDHRVLSATLVDDSGWATPAAGCAYYDLVTTGARTLDSWDETSDGGKSSNGCP